MPITSLITYLISRCQGYSRVIKVIQFLLIIITRYVRGRRDINTYSKRAIYMATRPRARACIFHKTQNTRSHAISITYIHLHDLYEFQGTPHNLVCYSSCVGKLYWLTALPLEEHGFTLHKTAFRDAIALRYGWPPSQIPSNCVWPSVLGATRPLLPQRRQ